MQIQARCPILRKLKLFVKLETITAFDLLSFLNGMPSLTIIEIGRHLSSVISDEVYVHLASRPTLVELQSNSRLRKV